MGGIRRLGYAGRLVLALGVGGAVFGIASAVQASIPDASGVIHGCYGKPGTPQKGQLRVVDASTGEQCRLTENLLSWNQSGRPGATGARGATGPTGAKGPSGLRGATGAKGTTGASGSTGATGANGATGAGGPTGQRGAAGVTGARGATGLTGPSDAYSVQNTSPGDLAGGGGFTTLATLNVPAGAYLVVGHAELYDDNVGRGFACTVNGGTHSDTAIVSSPYAGGVGTAAMNMDTTLATAGAIKLACGVPGGPMHTVEATLSAVKVAAAH